MCRVYRVADVAKLLGEVTVYLAVRDDEET